MATVDTAAARRRAPFGATTALLVAACLVMAAGARSLDLDRIAAFETFAVLFTSIAVEALPFVLLGALVAAAIEVLVSNRVFDRLGRLPVMLQVPGAALGGVAFPVCECGSVPVARRLIARGLHPAAGIAFMLAAPILNPVVLVSTWIAYSGLGLGLEMTVARAAGGLVLAVAAGWALGGDRPERVLRDRPDLEQEPANGSSMRRFAEHASSDFAFMGRYVVIGAAVAAALQTLVPQDILSGVARTPLVGALSLMGIAFLLSLCSEADAFVAVSFSPFPIGSQLAFLVFGPVVDAKLSLLYGATFRRGFVVRLALVAVPIALAESLWFEAVVK